MNGSFRLRGDLGLQGRFFKLCYFPPSLLEQILKFLNNLNSWDLQGEMLKAQCST